MPTNKNKKKKSAAQRKRERVLKKSTVIPKSPSKSETKFNLSEDERKQLKARMKLSIRQKTATRLSSDNMKEMICRDNNISKDDYEELEKAMSAIPASQMKTLQALTKDIGATLKGSTPMPPPNKDTVSAVLESGYPCLTEIERDLLTRMGSSKGIKGFETTTSE
jgi:hypothetical protein